MTNISDVIPLTGAVVFLIWANEEDASNRSTARGADSET